MKAKEKWGAGSRRGSSDLPKTPGLRLARAQPKRRKASLGTQAQPRLLSIFQQQPPVLGVPSNRGELARAPGPIWGSEEGAKKSEGQEKKLHPVREPGRGTTSRKSRGKLAKGPPTAGEPEGAGSCLERRPERIGGAAAAPCPPGEKGFGKRGGGAPRRG